MRNPNSGLFPKRNFYFFFFLFFLLSSFVQAQVPGENPDFNKQKINSVKESKKMVIHSPVAQAEKEYSQKQPTVKQTQFTINQKVNKQSNTEVVQQDKQKKSRLSPSGSLSTTDISQAPPPNVPLKPSAEASKKSSISPEQQLEIKKQKYAESLRGKGFAESEVSKRVNSRFPSEQTPNSSR